MTTTRKAGYDREGFDIDLREGQFAEASLAAILENPRVEVKRDYLTCKTGDVCVEIKGRDGRKAGLSVTEAEYFAFAIVGEDGTTIAGYHIFSVPYVWSIVNKWRETRGEAFWLVPCGDNFATLGAMIPLHLFTPGADWTPYFAPEPEDE